MIELLEDELDGVADFKGTEFGSSIDVARSVCPSDSLTEPSW